MPVLEELDTLEHPENDAAGLDRGILGSCLLLPAVASSQEPCQAFSLCFPIPLKSHLLPALPLGLNGCPMMPLLHFTSFLTQI